mgnify:CR=1 FL=1
MLINGKEYIELPVRPGYYAYQVAQDYLGSANLYPQIIRKSTMLNLTADSSRQLKAGEILLIPKKSNPVPSVNPSPVPAYPDAPTPSPYSESSDSNMNYYIFLGGAALLLYLMTRKKGKKR